LNLKYFFRSYTSVLPSDYNLLKAKATIGADAIKATYGTIYEIGSSAVLLCKFYFDLK
jgi:hypothetical protein